MDSIIRFTFVPIATWNDSFCRVRKSHVQSHITTQQSQIGEAADKYKYSG